MAYEEPGVINSINTEDRGTFRITWYTIQLGDTYSYQGFSGICLKPENEKKFAKSMCKTFGVKNVEELKGKKCIVLRCFPDHGEKIEGLMSVDTGAVISITKWAQDNLDLKTPDRLEQERETRLNEIRYAENRLQRARMSLAEMEEKYRSV